MLKTTALNKILFGIIGALLALFLFIAAVMMGTNLIGFQAVAVIELGISIAAGFLCSKKFAKDEMLKSISLGAFYGSIGYLVLIVIGKTVLFSLLSGITG